MKRTISIVLLSLSCCHTQPPPAATQTTIFSYSTEVQKLVGEKIDVDHQSNPLGVHINLNGSDTLIRNNLDSRFVFSGAIPAPKLTSYIDSIQDKLLAKSPYKIPKLKVEIYPSMRYNAEALSDNSVRIAVGLLKRAQTEDEVAFIVGHELSHLIMHHQARREQELQKAENGARIAAFGLLIASTYFGSKHVGKQIIVQPTGVKLGLGSDSGIRTFVAETINAVINPSWNIIQEGQADAMGLDLLVLAGYNPSAATHAFREMLVDEDDDARTLKRISASASKQRSEPASISEAFEEFTSAMGNSLDKFESELISLQASHPKTKDRDDAISKYRNIVYPQYLNRDMQTRNFLALQGSTEMKSVSLAVEAAGLADEALRNGLPAEAVRQAMISQRNAHGWWGSFYIAGLAYQDLKQRSDMIHAYQAAIELPGAPFEVFERVAYSLMRESGNVEVAQSVMDRAQQRFGSQELTLPDRISLYVKAKNDARADEMLKICLGSTNPRLRDACSRARIGFIAGPLGPLITP